MKRPDHQPATRFKSWLHLHIFTTLSSIPKIWKLWFPEQVPMTRTSGMTPVSFKTLRVSSPLLVLKCLVSSRQKCEEPSSEKTFWILYKLAKEFKCFPIIWNNKLKYIFSQKTHISCSEIYVEQIIEKVIFLCLYARIPHSVSNKHSMYSLNSVLQILCYR